jgi:multiple sugar transport system substrate-binding protein
MKKLIIYVVVAVVLLSGCAKKTVKNDNKINVDFWHAMGGPLGDALELLVKEYNESQSGIYINAVNMGNYTALSQKLMASIQTGNQPDIAQVYESWAANFIKGDLLLPIEDFIANDPDFGDEDLEDFFPIFLKSNTVAGQLISLPFNKSVRVLYYNKDILFQNDMNPNKPPITWADFRSMCKKLTQDFDGDGKTDQFGTALKINAWQFNNLLLQAGGEIMNEDQTKPLFNSPEGIRALDHFYGVLNKDKSGYLYPGYDGQNDFLASKIAMFEDSSVSIAYMNKAGIDFNIGIAAIPTDKTKRSVISGTNVAIFKSGDEKVQNAGWEFIKWFTDTEQTAKWSELTYYMPVRKSSMEQPNLKKRLFENSEIASVYKQLEHATFEPQISEWHETRKYMEEHVIEKVIKDILSPKEALDNAAKFISDKIKERK